VNGNTHLGGDDFDQKLMEHVIEQFRKDNGVDLRKDARALQRLKEACERAKCELSSMLETEINLPFIAQDANRQPLNLAVKMTRSKLEQLIGDLIRSSLKPVEAALQDAKLKPADINEVVLVGGSTRIPMVQKLVKDFFGREPNRSVNPDEIVAVGAAVQGAILQGDKDILLLDVTPLTLGLKVEGGLMVPLITRNSAIPTKKSQVFSTAADNQPAVTIEVYQGERPMANDNRKLGTFDLDGIPPARRGVPQIEVSFDLDANGILNVTAKDLGTSKQQQVTIKGSTGLSEAEIKKMVSEAEQYGEDDKKRKELVEAKNQADHILYQSEKTLKDNADKLPPGDKEKIEKASENLKKARDGEDIDAIKRAMEELATASHEFSKKLYEEAAKQQGAPQAQAAPPPPDAGAPPPQAKGDGKGPAGEKIIDAEFESK
jgi:molecular chaperone DnaK